MSQIDIFKCSAPGFEDGRKTMSQGMLVATRSKTAKEMHCPLECSGGSGSCRHHNFSSVRLQISEEF